MVVPFADPTIPSLLYVALLLAGTAILGALLYSVGVPLTQRTVLAMVPWMVAGSILHVFYQLGEAFGTSLYPAWIAPLFGAPAVYLTTFIGMGSIWLISTAIGVQSAAVTRDRVASYLAGTGIGVMLPLLGLLGWQAASPSIGPLRLVLPFAGLLLSLAVSFVVYILLGAWRTYIIAEARHVGGLLLFAHVFDGITTAIGVDLLGVGERSYVPRLIMDFARDLPTYQYLGAGWLFVVVKIVVAILVIVAFADYLSEHPRRGNLLFAAIIVVGLGPALNNFFLFVLGL